MVKLRTKCCPFCGCDQMTLTCDPVIVKHVYLRCDRCRAQGPSVFEEELMDGFIEAAPEKEIDRALEEIATDRWNCRPPMTDLYTDDLAAFEQFGETIESLERSQDADS